MRKDLQEVIDYLWTDASDPFPQYILRKEILRETPSDAEYEAIKTSKWYKQLAEEQWENGSWGRFHTQDTKALRKQKFVTTECAIRRARDLSLTKGDTIVQKSIGLMERYLCGKEAWLDRTEGKDPSGFAIAFKTLIAANLSLFDPQNPLLHRKKEICANNLAKAFAGDSLNEDIWESENRKSNDILLSISMVYPIWLLQNNAFLGENLQRKYLSWLWNRKGGIFYISNFTLSDMRSLEDTEFTQWLPGLENICDFSLFPEFMNKGITGHLLHEIHRLMTEDVALPAATSLPHKYLPITGHYAEKRGNKNARNSDLILRILRILIKAELHA